MSSQIISDNTSVVVKLEKETKPSMCRICLVENVRMHVVADKSLQELYEKLTDIPFVIEDNRPMLACFICYAKLKQCCQFQRQCLQAEELFTQMLNESYELYPAMYQSQLQWCGRFITTPIENISIVDDCRVEKDAIDVEIPAASETQYEIEIIQVKEEPLSNESDKQHDRYQELEDCPSEHLKSNSEDDLPLMVMKFEEEEQPAKQATSTSVAKNPELGIRKAKQEDITPAQHENNGLSDSKSFLATGNRTLLKSLKIKESIFNMNSTVNKCIVEVSTETLNKQYIKQVTNHSTTAIDTNCRNNGNENDLMCNDDDINRRQSLCIKEKPYKCDICQKSYTHLNILKLHIRMHTGEKPYKCDMCLKSFINHPSLERHIRTHTAQKPYECVICQKRFVKKTTLNAHVLIHTGEKPYKCDICQKCFTNHQSLERHVGLHTDERSYECNVCQKRFSKQCYLNEHFRIHTVEKHYKCDICQKTFAKKTNLNAHVRTHTGEKPYKCAVCQKGFVMKSHLNEHVRIHTGEKPYECSICQKAFAKKANLNAHVRVHTGEKPYKCDICHKSLTTNQSLESHVRIHSDERSYECGTCQKIFAKKSNLNAHVRIHTGEKPYVCEICQKSFVMKSHLNEHVRIHTGEKPYTCGICHKAFAKKANLNAHVRIHSGEKPYKCDVKNV